MPHVNRTDYQLIDISEDGFVSTLFLWSLFDLLGLAVFKKLIHKDIMLYLFY